jgi:aspartyl-tRNA(Asn)/glutamyl-tRNA(Gln) amidotransferase subunit B
VTGEYLRLRKQSGDPLTVDAAELASLIGRVKDGSLSRANAKEVFATHAATGQAMAAIVQAQSFEQISDAGAIGAAIDEVLASNSQAVADYRSGKDQAIGFLVGQVMKFTRGQANAGMVQSALRERLDGGKE